MDNVIVLLQIALQVALYLAAIVVVCGLTVCFIIGIRKAIHRETSQDSRTR